MQSDLVYRLFLLLVVFGAISSETIPCSKKILVLFSNVSLADISLWKDSSCIGKWKWAKSNITDPWISDDYAKKIFMDKNADIWIDYMNENDAGVYEIKYGVLYNFTGPMMTLTTSDIKSGKRKLFANIAVEDVSLYINTSMIAIWTLSPIELKWIHDYYARKIYMDSQSNILIYDVDSIDSGKYIIKYGILNNSTGPETELDLSEELSSEEQIRKWLDDHPKSKKKLFGSNVCIHEVYTIVLGVLFGASAILIVILSIYHQHRYGKLAEGNRQHSDYLNAYHRLNRTVGHSEQYYMPERDNSDRRVPEENKPYINMEHNVLAVRSKHSFSINASSTFTGLLHGQ